mgnify:CR=1 FL=1
MPPRFLQLSDVAELLNISASQTYALVRSGELPAIIDSEQLAFEINALGRLEQLGLTELFFESAEPSPRAVAFPNENSKSACTCA